MEALGKETLEALAASVKEEKDRAAKNNKELKTKSRPSLPIRISVPHENKEFVLDWKLGSSLLDVAKDNEETMGNSHIEGACGGTMSCCTCHVYIEPPDFREYLIEPTDTELDMLDLAYAPRDNSRLGCQVKLTPAILKSPMLKQFEVTIPPGVNNVFDC